ncbi:hypothetical protein EDI_070430 [Entamoeba dispar SAW760]|uniref:RRM domain-containing protein n=1 Tax=Entamoeba dispar (strain ATCC PRA-260 / SAW760) TaxID=370354 RepID=B0EM83_ENTDS|nr:uncharacterized protein EDI_070430 [Entamoeba dispar SAW760]EDR24301.1 hypothetical protein EDI_070430 [Entamoeba dispar SAW760]|eukprot:EDR24301.1 hypothetical protein EDI_070430 [Entamoeba dispar SAW760]
MDPYCYRICQFYTCVKVTNLNKTITPLKLMNLFEHCGDIVSIRISKLLNGNKWAIIDFGESKAVELAELLSGSMFEDRLINVYGCTLGKNDFDNTEDFYFGRSLPLSTKEKNTLSGTSIRVESDGNSYFINTSNHLTKGKKYLSCDNFKIIFNTETGMLELLEDLEEMGRNRHKEFESKRTKSFDENSINEEIFNDDILNSQYEQNFELLKEEMNTLDWWSNIEFPIPSCFRVNKS